MNLTLGVGEEDWGVFVLGRYGSGLPYTPVINQAEGRGEDAARAVQRNSRRRPENYTVDLRVFKNFTFGPLTASVFVKVFNLFDRRNEADLYGETGRAYATVEALGAANVDATGRVNSVGDLPCAARLLLRAARSPGRRRAEFLRSQPRRTNVSHEFHVVFTVLLLALPAWRVCR